MRCAGAGVLKSGGDDMTWSFVGRLIKRNFPTVPHVSTEDLARRLADPAAQPVVLLDVRTVEEYQVSHLPSARRVEPKSDDLVWLETMARDTTIVAYCSVGYRSARLVKQLADAGFSDVANLEGSIFRWANEGRPVVRDGVEVWDVHPYDVVMGRLLTRELRARKPRNPAS